MATMKSEVASAEAIDTSRFRGSVSDPKKQTWKKRVTRNRLGERVNTDHRRQSQSGFLVAVKKSQFQAERFELLDTSFLNLIRIKTDPKTVQTLLRHSAFRLTLQFYTHCVNGKAGRDS